MEAKLKNFLLGCVACAALSGQANASLMTTASLFSPLAPSGTTTTNIAIQSAPLGGATYVGTGFTITSSVPSGQGIVLGAIPSATHATPVAGVTSSGQAQYLSGDFGSALVTDPTVGKYLSTGTGSITITFATPQTSLALLWGSIDSSNSITFNDAANDTLTGTQVQTLAAGFMSNGFQGPKGSAYVTTTTNTSFTKVTLNSGITSFEASGIAGTSGSFTVPEPLSLAILGSGLVGLGLTRRRKAS